MITELSAQNFKSWEDTGKLQFAPLTGFFGANSSGKTSLLQPLLLFKQTVERPVEERPPWNPGVIDLPQVRVDNSTGDPLSWSEPLYFGDDESLVNFGDFDAIIHRHDQNLSLLFCVSWKSTEGGYIGQELSFSSSIHNRQGELKLDFFRYVIGKKDFEIRWTPQGFMFTQNMVHVEPFRSYAVMNPTEDLASFPSLRKALENLFFQIRHLGPLREYPRHRYTWEGDHPEGVGQHGEKMIPALLSGRVRLLSIDEQIPKWLQKFNLIDSYDLHPVANTGKDYEFLVKQHQDGPKVRLTDIGFGVSQVLPVLVFCYSAPENSILILEQPEAHLHPKAQSELADVLIDVVKTRNTQIILESHSEHLLHRLQRRIAEEKISADDTAFYFCQIKNGNSKAERLNVDEYGNIRNYPPDFFGDDLGDLVKKTEAEMKRREATE